MTSLPAELLAEKLEHAASQASDPMRVALTALSTWMFALAFGNKPLRAYLELMLTEDTDRIAHQREAWEAMCGDMPYLQERVNPLIDWIDTPGEHDDEALRRCFALLLELDMYEQIERHDGEFLGLVYQDLTRVQRDERGELYDYPSVRTCFLLAHLNGLQRGDVLSDRACGAGAMAVATIREFRARGGMAETLGFILNDPDPIAVALAGINLAAYGMERVLLNCEDLSINPWGDEPPKAVTGEGAEEQLKGRTRRRAS